MKLINVQTENDSAEGIRVTVIGALANVALSVLKIIVGLYGQSRALMADGFHSLSDLATDVVVIFGLKIGSRPLDRNHPYGHKKMETLAEVVIGVFLLGFAVAMLVSSVRDLVGGVTSRPGVLALTIAAVSVASKEFLFRFTMRVARRTDSGALLANAWHHRSDALSSLAVLAAIGLTWVHPALRFLDPLAGIAISALVGKIGFDVMVRASRHLVDTAPEPQILERIQRATERHPDVLNFHKLRARYLGGMIIADLHIRVDPSLTVREGHAIASDVEKSITEELGNVYDVTVHVEPHYGGPDGNGDLPGTMVH